VSLSSWGLSEPAGAPPALVPWACGDDRDYQSYLLMCAVRSLRRARVFVGLGRLDCAAAEFAESADNFARSRAYGPSRDRVCRAKGIVGYSLFRALEATSRRRPRKGGRDALVG